jgi:TolB-like protein/Tfp pilus assembly protein PilF/predicted Ser/Thr protein kinase
MKPMIGQTISHYKILEKLGEGGMGVVYKAEDVRLGRTVALKFLPPELTRDQQAKERFIREARSASALDHANICTIYEINEADGQTFIAMAYVEGESLQDRILDRPLDLDETLRIAIQIARGLGEAHEKGIIHRDIKPANIMITAKGQVKIMDFGLAKLIGTREITEKEATPGTIAYMSPEQTRGEKVDHRTDIWSLGVVLYEMLTGRRPFRGDYYQAVVYSILNEEPEPVHRVRSGLPPGLRKLIARALAKDITRRYENVGQLIADLQRVREGLPPRHAPVQGAAKRISWTRILGVVSILAVLIVAMFGIFLVKQYFTTRSAEPQRPTARAGIDWQNSIAVLPFRDYSPKGDQEYFCDGMTEAIIGKLSGLTDLKVISMTSAMRYKSPDRDIKKIGQELDVATILEGSVQREDDRIRVRAQLINTADDAHLWTQTYDRELASVFAIQDEISQAIVDVMKIKLLGDEWTSFVKRPTESIDAYNAYVQGRFLWNKRTEENLYKAIEYFEEAIQLDPDYAQAYAGLADVYAVIPSNIDYPQAEAIPRIRRAALKALELDNTLAEAHSSLALAMEMEGDQAEAEKAFQKAIELNPGYAYAHYWYSNFLERQGRAEESARERGIAVQLNPLSVVILTRCAWFRAMESNIAGAEELFERALEIEPSRLMTYTAYGGALRHAGRPEKAINVYERGIEQIPGDREFYNHLAYLYVLVDDREKAVEMADRVVESAPEEANSYDTRGDIYAFHGDLSNAIENYRKAVEIEFYFNNSIGKLASMYIYKGEYAEAERIIRRIAEEPDIRFQSSARTGLAYIPLYQGKLEKALAMLDEGISWDRKHGIDDHNLVAKHNVKFFVCFESGRSGPAWKEAEILKEHLTRLSPEDPFSYRTAYAILYAQQGDDAKADSLLQVIGDNLGPKEPNLESGYHRMIGAVELIKGNPRSAIEHLQLGLCENSVPLFESRYMLGLAYLEMNQPARSVEVLEPALRRYDEHMMQFPLWAVKARYYLGKAYDRMGKRQEAIARYGEFLEIWKDADEGIEEVEEARERVAALRTQS